MESRSATYSRCPQISHVAARVVAAATEAAAVARPHGLNMPAAVVAACAQLEVNVTRGVARRSDERRITIDTLAELVTEHQTAFAGHVKARTAQLSATMLRDRLAVAYDEAANPGPLEQYVTALVSSGVDGERLTWAVIGFEAQRHVRLIMHEANKLANHFPDQTTDNMISYGWLGLRLALRRFDPELGLQFSTYACKRISGSIRDGMRHESHLAKRLITQVRRISANEEQLAAELGRTPTREEVAQTVGMTVAELAATARFAAPASLDELRAGFGDRASEPRVLTLDDDTVTGATDALLADAVEAAFAELPEDLADLARMVLYEGMSVADAERLTGVPARQVRQRCNQAKQHLAVALADWA